MLQLENAKQVAAKNSDFATSTREELAGTKLRVESQSMQISNLQKQVQWVTESCSGHVLKLHM